VIAQLSIGLLTFVRPRRLGTFGSTVKAGRVDDFKIGDVRPVPAGKFYVARVPEGFIALCWKCPHVGCTVPWEPLGPVEDADRAFADRGHFKCACHASQYNRYGQITNGPAPGPMDRFPLRIETAPSWSIPVPSGRSRARSRGRRTLRRPEARDIGEFGQRGVVGTLHLLTTTQCVDASITGQQKAAATAALEASVVEPHAARCDLTDDAVVFDIPGELATVQTAQLNPGNTGPAIGFGGVEKRCGHAHLGFMNARFPVFR
jgi:nitrite reductase/ring-hydroxylating ferredoxin subunit